MNLPPINVLPLERFLRPLKPLVPVACSPDVDGRKKMSLFMYDEIRKHPGDPDAVYSGYSGEEYLSAGR